MKLIISLLLLLSFGAQANLSTISSEQGTEAIEKAMESSTQQLCSALLAIDISKVSVTSVSNEKRFQLSVTIPESSLGALQAYSGLKIRSLKILLNEIYLAQLKRSEIDLKALTVDFYSY